MKIFGKRVSYDEYEKIVAENNTMKFEIERLKRSVADLQRELEKVTPRIQALTDRINEQQRYIDKYHIEVTSDKEKWEKHQKIANKRGVKREDE